MRSDRREIDAPVGGYGRGVARRSERAADQFGGHARNRAVLGTDRVTVGVRRGDAPRCTRGGAIARNAAVRPCEIADRAHEGRSGLGGHAYMADGEQNARLELPLAQRRARRYAVVAGGAGEERRIRRRRNPERRTPAAVRVVHLPVGRRGARCCGGACGTADEPCRRRDIRVVAEHIETARRGAHAGVLVGALDDRRPRGGLQCRQGRVLPHGVGLGFTGRRRRRGGDRGQGRGRPKVRRDNDGGRGRIWHLKQIEAVSRVADEDNRSAVGRHVGPGCAARHVRQLARGSGGVDAELVQIERPALEIGGGDDRAAVGPPRRRHQTRVRVGGNNPRELCRDIDDDDLGWAATSMTFDGDREAVWRPTRRVELRLRLRDEGDDGSRGRTKVLRHECRSWTVARSAGR